MASGADLLQVTGVVSCVVGVVHNIFTGTAQRSLGTLARVLIVLCRAGVPNLHKHAL